MRLPTMQALVFVEELGSIRAAAQKMNLTQPALTAAIQQLEAELKAPLLVRSRQGVTFTSFGQAFLKHAKLMVAQSRRAQDEIAQLRGHWEGTVKMAISPAIGLGLLPQALRQFTQQYPNVKVHCRDGLYPSIAPAVRDGTLDFALTPVHRVDLESDLVAEPLYSSQVVIVSRVSHPLSRATRLRQLQDCEWVLSSTSRGPGAVIEEAFQKAGLGPPRVKMLCESFLALPAVVAASDDWMTTMPQVLFENCAFKEQLCALPIQDALPSPLICMVRRHDLPLTPAAMQIVGWIQHFALKRMEAKAG
ncbi:LysR substrate-binding domain-containing protein [Ottowia sp. VDI28]|uniref:LysR substrate-binding domain-containing protein n=1 Tax=Ottowia sp. VDI28 TaxID=3133968 RepID=UPI003C2D0BF3